MNISCPNVANRGLVFACDPSSASAVVSAVTEAVGGRVPVLAKLSPDVTDIVAIAGAVLDAGADGLSMINTTLGMVIDVDPDAPAPRRRDRGPVRPGDPADRRPVRLAGPRRDARRDPAARPDRRDRRRRHRPGRRRARARRRVRRPGRHRDLPRPGHARRVATDLAAVLAGLGFARFADAVGHAHTVLARETEPNR